MVLKIGEHIKRERKRAKMTQKDLAEKSGLATITIQQYERGVREPRAEIVYRIAKALGVLPTKLIDDMENELAEFIENHPNDYDTLIQFSSDDENELDPTIKKQLVLLFNRLNDHGITVALERIEELTEIQRYRKDPSIGCNAPDGECLKTE